MEVDGSMERKAIAGGRFEGVVTPPLAPWIRVAGVVGLVAVAAAYLWLGGTWWVGLALLLAPDLAFIGFAFGPRPGVAAYNAVHRPVVPAVLLVVALVLGSQPAALLMLIWLAHIAMDRAAGYGLKRAPQA